MPGKHDAKKVTERHTMDARTKQIMECNQKLVADSFPLLNNLIQVSVETHGDEFGWSMAASGITAMLNQVIKDFNVNSTSLETALMEGLHEAARARKQELN